MKTNDSDLFIGSFLNLCLGCSRQEIAHGEKDGRIQLACDRSYDQGIREVLAGGEESPVSFFEEAGGDQGCRLITGSPTYTGFKLGQLSLKSLGNSGIATDDGDRPYL